MIKLRTTNDYSTKLNRYKRKLDEKNHFDSSPRPSDHDK